MMLEQDKFSNDLSNLERILVQQFRLLQKLVEISQVERSALLNGSETLPGITEDKEVLLDQLGMVDDSRRKTVNDLAVACKITTDFCTVGELIPHLNPSDAASIKRISEGISTLVIQARELNQANLALAHVKIDLLKATQAFLINLAQPEIDYRPAGTMPVSREASSWGMERRA